MSTLRLPRGDTSHLLATHHGDGRDRPREFLDPPPATPQVGTYGTGMGRLWLSGPVAVWCATRVRAPRAT
eukprot:5995581-Pleurochrysis_carterae.AAC.1